MARGRRRCGARGARRAEQTLIAAEQLDQFLWLMAAAVALCAAWTDLRARRIPNWLTLSAAAAGLLVNAAGRGARGTFDSLGGAALMLGVLLPVVLLRGIGPGDWKLMGALGALLGGRRVVIVLIASLLLAGLIAGAQMILRGRVRETVGNLWELVRGFFIFGLRPNPRISLDNPAASSVPFGAAAAAATLLCYAAFRAGRW